MNRQHVHLTDRQLAALRALANRTGLSVAEHIRRAVDDYLRQQRETKRC